MVFLHVKKSNETKDEFLFEASVKDSNEDVIRRLVEVNNLRIRLSVLSAAIIDLGKYGQMKDPKEQGIDHIQVRWRYNEDIDNACIDKWQDLFFLLKGWEDIQIDM